MSPGYLFLFFLSCTEGNAFFSFKKIPKLQDPLEATHPLPTSNHHEALQVQKPQFKRIFKKVQANEDEVARSLKASGRANPSEASDERKAATRTLGAIVSANLESTVADKHLESVAKSMKTVVATKIQNPKHGFFRRPHSHFPRGTQFKVDHISKPVAKSFKLEAEEVSSQENLKEVDHSLSSVAKSMKAVVDRVESQQEGQAVIQGFKVQGDPSNKIVFLDLDALRSSGISLDSSRISIGSSGLGKNLQPIEGLEAISPNFQSIVEQRLEEDAQAVVAESPEQPSLAVKQVSASQAVVAETPEQPSVAVKQVSASQAVSGGGQVSLGPRVAVPTGEIVVIRPQTSAGDNAAQRKSLFFAKFQGRNTAKPSAPTNNQQASPTTTAHQEGRSLSGHHQRGGDDHHQRGGDDHHPQQHFKHFGFGGI